ncbi:hypothetical protein, partial [Bacteroides heparinolyticus]|uniref:hypothetical protein n=1 Tax=Prevotella heparinolytica TaxID=28113 RepID=UPI003AEF45FE
TPKTNSRRTSGRRKFEIRGLVRKNKYSQHVIVNELGVDNYGLADSNNCKYNKIDLESCLIPNYLLGTINVD